jgi:hypothetical protein
MKRHASRSLHIPGIGIPHLIDVSAPVKFIPVIIKAECAGIIHHGFGYPYGISVFYKIVILLSRRLIKVLFAILLSEKTFAAQCWFVLLTQHENPADSSQG